jgi:enterochelin esterase-like enzyme
MLTARRPALALVLLLAARVSADDARLVSPEVGKDGAVVFRLRAPQATSVTLHGNWSGAPEASPMKRGEDGVWTATVGPLDPQIYTYSFDLDGARIPDPANVRVLASVSWGMASLVEVVGERPAPWNERTAVPAGTLTTHTYANGTDRRRVIVYTPPGYEKSRDRYPVLYLVHGFGDDERAWTATGRANLILDNLIADGKMVPAVVVMPNAHTLPPAPFDEFDWAGNSTRFRDDLLSHVIPLVESRYRVRTDAAHRAIAGLSMGGGHALFTGLAYPDRFAWIASMSGAIRLDVAGNVDARAVNRNVRLLWIGCGLSDEGSLSGNRALVSTLKQLGIRHEWHETDGAHTWMVWRENLAAILPLLFRG